MQIINSASQLTDSQLRIVKQLVERPNRVFDSQLIQDINDHSDFGAQIRISTSGEFRKRWEGDTPLDYKRSLFLKATFDRIEAEIGSIGEPLQ